MWSAYSAAKLLFLVLLVEASLGRHIKSFNCNESLINCYKSNFEIVQTCWCSPKNWYPDGNVTIRWDIMNETSTSYTANVTIFNYMKYHDIEGPWELRWSWLDDEILLSNVGVKSSNLTILPNMNSITIVELPPQTDADDDERIAPSFCKGGVIPRVGKSSFSFQIDVGRANLKHHLPAIDVTLTTPSWIYRCHQLMKVTNTPGYLSTWSTDCRLFIPLVLIRHI